MNKPTDWAKAIAGPLVRERVKNVVQNWCDNSKGDACREDLESAIADELLAHLRESGLNEYFEAMDKVAQDLREAKIQGPTNITVPVRQAMDYIAERIETAKAKLLGGVK